MIKNLQISCDKLKKMEEKIPCKFSEVGPFSEMILELSDYQEKTTEIKNIKYGLYKGNQEQLHQIIAKVNKNWVRYFDINKIIFCGYIQNKPVSFCLIETHADNILEDKFIKIGGIACVGTIPEYRKMGIGLRLVDLATLYLKKKGFDYSYIHYTHLEKWYNKLGYQGIAKFSLV